MDRTGPSRRNLLATAGIAAGALAATPVALAETPPGGYGMPLVELHVPAGILSVEQKAEMIKGVTDVVLGAIQQTPDPTRRLFVEILETAEGGYGVNGRAFLPRPK